MEMQNNMTQNNPSPAPAGEPATGNPMGAMPTHENQWGPIIGAVVIVAVLIAGGYYYWMQHKDALSGNSAQSEQSGSDILNGEDKALDALKTQSTSSAYSAIEADLNATDLNSIDSDLQNAGNELGI